MTQQRKQWSLIKIRLIQRLSLNLRLPSNIYRADIISGSFVLLILVFYPFILIYQFYICTDISSTPGATVTVVDHLHHKHFSTPPPSQTLHVFTSSLNIIFNHYFTNSQLLQQDNHQFTAPLLSCLHNLITVNYQHLIAPCQPVLQTPSTPDLSTTTLPYHSHQLGECISLLDCHSTTTIKQHLITSLYSYHIITTNVNKKLSNYLVVIMTMYLILSDAVSA